MEPCIKTGRRSPLKVGREGRERGFTLIEIMIVLALVAILAAIAVPVYTKSVVRAREAALSENLYIMRDAIDKYYGDNQADPDGREVLIEKRLLGALPLDPMTNSTETWIEDFEGPIGGDDFSEGAVGMRDVHSGSDIIGRNGVSYSEW